MNTVLRLLGPLAFMATAVGTALALGVAAYGAGSGRRSLARRALLAVVALLTVHSAALVAGPLFTPERTLAAGEELSFCEFDCHLHLTATGSERHGDTLLVDVRVRSDARRAPEHPEELALVLIDAEGTRHAPVSELAAGPLPAGVSALHRIGFVAPSIPEPAKLVAYRRGTIDYLVPGSQNPLVQRRAGVVVPSAPVAR